MLKLPQDEEALFQEDLRRIEEELAMPYMTAIERMGRNVARNVARNEGSRRVRSRSSSGR